MGLFRKQQPTKQQVKAFGRGQQTSAAAAEAYAQQARDAQATRDARAERLAADRAARRRPAPAKRKAKG